MSSKFLRTGGGVPPFHSRVPLQGPQALAVVCRARFKPKPWLRSFESGRTSTRQAGGTRNPGMKLQWLLRWTLSRGNCSYASKESLTSIVPQMFSAFESLRKFVRAPGSTSHQPSAALEHLATDLGLNISAIGICEWAKSLEAELSRFNVLLQRAAGLQLHNITYQPFASVDGRGCLRAFAWFCLRAADAGYGRRADHLVSRIWFQQQTPTLSKMCLAELQHTSAFCWFRCQLETMKLSAKRSSKYFCSGSWEFNMFQNPN